MSSLSNTINILQNVVEDKTNDEKMAVALDCSSMELIHRLNCCMNPYEFEHWHLRQLDWIHRNAQNEKLERLCEAVAMELRPAIMKVYTLQHHTWYRTTFPTPFCSARHMVVSALENVLSAFRAFQNVYSEPDLSAIHIRAMVQRYLSNTFDLMFLFGDLAPRRRGDRLFLRYWEAALLKTSYQDFSFDNDFDYACLDRHQMENTNLSGAIPPPGQFPASCLPHHPSRPVVVLNICPYGPSIMPNH
ncbi:hypothetical protein N431DRAFT_242061 [Stipitochalara longipes BDJ]|nr:hypothetical protein N431DRAFT_242061 [Stipitochalara longipes BDJ]